MPAWPSAVCCRATPRLKWKPYLRFT